MGELEGTVAVITGAGSGMAKASARAFVREGAYVLGVDISGREQETAAELGERFAPFHGDMTDESDVAAAYAAALAAFGRIDVVLNVVGVGGAQPVDEITLDHYERLVQVNFRTVMLSTRQALQTMVPSGGGVIINWSSMGGMNASPRRATSVYSASKAAVIAFTKATAIEFATKGIRANVICPGFIVTEGTGGPESLQRYPQLVDGCPMKRAGQPDEVAELACFLASKRAPYITGAVIPIDGGASASLP